MSELASLCNICNRPSRNLNTCQSCGAIVCSKHFNEKKGICTLCERGVQI